MKKDKISKNFRRDFLLGLPLLIEILAAFVIARTPWANYATYLLPVIASTIILTLVVGTIMALLDAWQRTK